MPSEISLKVLSKIDQGDFCEDLDKSESQSLFSRCSLSIAFLRSRAVDANQEQFSAPTQQLISNELHRLEPAVVEYGAGSIQLASDVYLLEVDSVSFQTLVGAIPTTEQFPFGLQSVLHPEQHF
jgi:hypothetical protein